MARHPSKIAAVVVTHDRVAQLRLTVERLLAEPIANLIVIDNATRDMTAPWLATLDDPRLLVHRTRTNVGGAGGFSLGMQLARDLTDADWIVVMDDDGRPAPGALSAFRRMDPQGWDAIGAAVFHPDGRICEMNRPYRNPFWRLPEFLSTLARMPLGQGRKGFHLADRAYAGHAPVREVDMSSFVGLFLSRAALIRAGLPDPRLFIYGDDQLYTLRMRLAGLRIGFAPQIRFEHETTALQGRKGVVLRPLWKVYYMYRNALIAYRVAAGPWFRLLVPVLLRKWRRKAPDYGGDAPVFGRLLEMAIADGMAERLDRPHPEIVRLAQA